MLEEWVWDSMFEDPSSTSSCDSVNLQPSENLLNWPPSCMFLCEQQRAYRPGLLTFVCVLMLEKLRLWTSEPSWPEFLEAGIVFLTEQIIPSPRDLG